jgi:uncharacterized DUF497 family protein
MSAPSKFTIQTIPKKSFLLLGFSRTLRLLVVCHCYQREANVMRIISARTANAN